MFEDKIKEFFTGSEYQTNPFKPLYDCFVQMQEAGFTKYEAILLIGEMVRGASSAGKEKR